jgi:hypothetical protein
MREFAKKWEEQEYGPILAIVVTSIAIACLEFLT